MQLRCGGARSQSCSVHADSMQRGRTPPALRLLPWPALRLFLLLLLLLVMLPPRSAAAALDSSMARLEELVRSSSSSSAAAAATAADYPPTVWEVLQFAATARHLEDRILQQNHHW
ncbi:uncharacterized protein Tco025E_02271 [Trypanosoma conorhini]|uniref:Uncharacterized protein n=1 Tax=Trypanosoma conorhini TaxID=83891 RepID=A0A3R7PHD7_9TRYP|nr:uncharacterized protein Tco025E_02271 [Trypanosoma conorhini]RNF25367.1 hypothetical protein Tco025E_02271 [Trypanosoma conorhini]